MVSAEREVRDVIKHSQYLTIIYRCSMKVFLLASALVCAAILSISCSSDSSPLASSTPKPHEVGWVMGKSKPDTTKPSGGCKCPPESISLNFEEIKVILDGLIDDVTPPPGTTAGLLLPAVQKVREAASRSRAAMEGSGRVASAVDALQVLGEMLDVEQQWRSGSGGGAGKATLNDLILSGGTGAQGHIKSAKLFVRKQGSEMSHTEAAELVEYLMGYACAGTIQIADEEQPSGIRHIRAELLECLRIAESFTASVDLSKRVRY